MKAIIFDMDGVLFDTEKLCRDNWIMLAREQGITDMEEVFMQCVGRNTNDTRTLLLNHYGQDFPYDSFRKRASNWFWNTVAKDGVPIKPGVYELLEYLKQAGYGIGLASSSRKESVISHLTSTGLLEFFSVIVTGDMVEHSKPQPDIYLLACDRMHVVPQEAYAIEDSFNGIRAAYAAGMKPIMVPDLIAPDDEMEKISFCICESLLEVRDFLSQLQ